MTRKKSTSEERSGLIIIGTQVLEQSLDIDFDLLITQLCPMDLLLQRMGRLHRHLRKRPKELSEARCLILDLVQESDEGSRSVYGDWLLLRTRELLPETVMLPGDIPELVQNTYRVPDDHLLLDAAHCAAWEKYHTELEIKKRKAESYRIDLPQKPFARRKKTIDGWLESSIQTDARGCAAVRDGEAGIRVLVMQERADGYISFLPWQSHQAMLSATHAPDDDNARRIAAQCLTLPLSFSMFGREEKTIKELETLNRKKLPEWQNSAWLNGELILLLDDRLHATLCDQRLYYSKEFGLICEKGVGPDDTKL